MRTVYLFSLYVLSGLPSPPQNPVTTVHYDTQNITVVVQWSYPQSGGGAPVDNYTVTLVGPGAVRLSTTTSIQPVATFTLVYNEEYTVSIAATNCAGTGGTVSLNISQSETGKCNYRVCFRCMNCWSKNSVILNNLDSKDSQKVSILIVNYL